MNSLHLENRTNCIFALDDSLSQDIVGNEDVGKLSK